MTTDKSQKILGLGNDILEIERIRESYEKHGDRFLEKLFTKNEREYFTKHKHPEPHIAGRFAAKEAIAKALGTGFGKDLSWLDIEILNNPNGRPLVSFSQEIRQKIHPGHIMLSISHCHNYASAVAIWVND